MLHIKKIGVLRETKVPADRRVPLTPVQAVRLSAINPSLQLVVQPSKDRAYSDEEYSRAGIRLQEDLSDCDLLVGVKEVKQDCLIPDKAYLFFAHVIKKQPHNRELFQAVLSKRITLIDYELLTDSKGRRLVAFGRWAGIVGAYNGIRAWGLRYGQFSIPPAHSLDGMAALCRVCKDIHFPPVKILITGEGRVAGGAIEILQCAGAVRAGSREFLEKDFSLPVYCQIGPQQYTRHIEGKTFEFSHFVSRPEEFLSAFAPYTRAADLYISAHFWDPRSPGLIGPGELSDPGFSISVIADISCDVGGAVLPTLRASTIEYPFYDYNPRSGKEEKAFSSKENITVMAVDNLPAELPRDSSESFGNALLETIFPAFLGKGEADIIERATIVKEGILTESFGYLGDYA